VWCTLMVRERGRQMTGGFASPLSSDMVGGDGGAECYKSCMWEGMGGRGLMQGFVWRDGSCVRAADRCVGRMALAEWMERQKR
jgi:hypothetical protein